MNNFNLQSLINNQVINKNDVVKEFYSLLDKQNEVCYFRRIYLVNFLVDNEPSGLIDVRDCVEKLDFAGFIAEACLHPSVIVEVDDHSVQKVKSSIDLFLKFIEQGKLLFTIDIEKTDEALDVFVLELELSVHQGLPVFNCTICKNHFDGFTVDKSNNSIQFKTLETVQIVDYIEIELF